MVLQILICMDISRNKLKGTVKTLHVIGSKRWVIEAYITFLKFKFLK